MTVSEASLGTLTYLAEGGFGKVYRAGGFTLPGDPSALAYKQFTVDHARQEAAARAAVDFRDALGPAGQAELDERCAWPRVLVTDAGGAVCGLLMPLIPPEFFVQGGRMDGSPREMAWLVSAAAQRAAAGVDFAEVPRTDRLVLLAQLAYAIGWLHKNDWVFGDLSFGNAVFALNPPRMMLLDCDGAASMRNSARRQSSTPLWDPPECPIQSPPGGRQQELQDPVTDVYKLGLAVLRCMSPGKGAASSRKVSRLGAELDAAGTSLVARALSADRATRPAAREIYAYLRQAALSRVRLPEVRAARMVPACCPRGTDVHISWEVDHAAEVTIRSGNNDTEVVSLSAHPLGYTVRPSASGPVSIEASNTFGLVRVDLGQLTLYELPPLQVSIGRLPALYVPELSAFQVAGISSAMAARPAAPVGLSLPAIPALSAPELMARLFPASPAAGPPPGGAAGGQAAGSVTAVIHQSADAFRDILTRRLEQEQARLAQPGQP